MDCLPNNPEIKVAIIIDNENFIEISKRISSRGKQFQADYEKFAKRLLNGRKSTKMIFVGKRSKGRNQPFYSVLSRIGFEIIIPEDSSNIENNWDDKKIIEILQNMYNGPEDVVILVGGDHVFREPLEKLKNQGKKIEIVNIYNCVSNELLKLGDFLDIHSIKDEIIYSEKEAPRPSEFMNKIEISISGYLRANTIPDLINELNKINDKFFPDNNVIVQTTFGNNKK